MQFWLDEKDFVEHKSVCSLCMFYKGVSVGSLNHTVTLETSLCCFLFIHIETHDLIRTLNAT